MVFAVSTWLLRGFAGVVGLLGWRGAQRLGAALGLIWFHLVRIRRRTVAANLARTLPDRTGEHRRIARESYRHVGISTLELFLLRRLDREALERRVRAHGLERYEEALAEGHGVVVVTGHYGNFDLLACSQASRGVRLAIVSRDLHGSGSNAFWMETRGGTGLEIFSDSGAARRLLSWLRADGVLGLVVDQRTGPDRGGVRLPFLGVPAWTTTAPARLALASRAPVLPVRIERGADGNHDVYVEERIPLPEGRDEEAVIQLTTRINDVLETWVRRRPEHWMWLHRRFAGAGDSGP